MIIKNSIKIPRSLRAIRNAGVLGCDSADFSGMSTALLQIYGIDKE